MQQWGYEAETPELGEGQFEWEYLAAKGKEGWELVSVVDSYHSYTGSPAKKFYFKRLIQQRGKKKK